MALPTPPPDPAPPDPAPPDALPPRPAPPGPAPDDAGWSRAQALAEAHAPFLRALLRGWPALLPALRADGPDRVFSGLIDQLDDALVALPQADARRALRQLREQVALLCALADLAGVWSLEQTTAALSAFADRAIDRALRLALRPILEAGRLRRIDGGAVTGLEESGLICLAMGKLGGGELNYSSDVDLIFFFDEQAVTDRDGAVPTDVFVRVVQSFVAILQDRTADGYVLRVDLRLRPDPNATPVALSMAAAEVYYHSAALTWERAAFTRARVCAGDPRAAAGFMARMAPWIWRRSMDHAAIRDIHTMKAYVEAYFDQETVEPGGFDVKRGVGGIREIEFFVQIQQLVLAGRRPELRQANTLAGLRALTEAGQADARTTARLAEAYRFLRMVEHRIQMVADEQTHVVPRAAAARKALAALCGFAGREAFERALARTARRVRRHYQALLGPAGSIEPADRPFDPGQLDARLGPQARTLVEGWQRGRYRAFRSERARASLDRLLPVLTAGLGASADPPTALARLDDFFAHLPSGVQFLELLESHPPLGNLLLRTITTAPALGEQLARRPALFDAVLDPQFFGPLDDPAARAADLARACERAATSEERIDLAGQWLAEQRFRTGVLLIDRKRPAMEAAMALAHVADAVVRLTVDALTRQFEAAHGRVPGCGLALVALGGWGGSLLLPGSDLDLIAIFDGAHDAQSDGRRPLPATVYFNRLAQRIVGALTAQRPDGALYEVDTRLRPSGAQGLLAVTLPSFLDYQLNSAWTWEHLALTRARVVTGAPDFAGRIEAGVAAVIARPRDPAGVVRDVTEMRAEMSRHRPAQGPLDVKLAAGGLIDIEFIVQSQLLLLGRRPPGSADLRQALHALVEAGAVSASDGRLLLRAWLGQTALRVIVRQCLGGDDARIGADHPVTALLARAVGAPDWPAAQARVTRWQADVRRVWQSLMVRRR